MNPWLAYFLGVVTLPVLYGALELLGVAFARDMGSGGCFVCTHAPVYEIGERFRITAWFQNKWHRYFWSYRKWHREAWRAHRFYRGEVD